MAESKREILRRIRLSRLTSRRTQKIERFGKENTNETVKPEQQPKP
jgi:hypothetical protein